MKQFKVFALLIAALFIVTAFTFVGTDSAVEEGGDQVAICHLEGHVGDFVIGGGGRGCVNGLGGNVIIVGQKACEKGHKARGDCTRDNVGGVFPGCLQGNPDTCSSP